MKEIKDSNDMLGVTRYQGITKMLGMSRIPKNDKDFKDTSDT